MNKEVFVTRKGQTTIPVELRVKYNIKEDTRLVVVDAGDGIMFRRALTTVNLAAAVLRASPPKK